MRRQRLFLIISALVSATLWAYACGDGTTEPPPPPPDPPRPATVTVSPATIELTALGATVQLTAAVRDQNGQAMAGATVTWASSATGVATVTASGQVTAVANGTATITATAGSASGNATVSVTQQVSAVAVTPDTATVLEGDTLRLAATATDANGQAVPGVEFVWASGDTAAAVVDGSGLVTGVGAGEAEVTATAVGVTGRAQLTVVAPMPTVVAVTPDTVVLTALGQTAQLAAEVRDQVGRVMNGVSVVWSSADTTVAVVDATGLVTAVSDGIASITAIVGEASASATVTVAQEISTVAVAPDTATVLAGDTLRLAATATDANEQTVAGVEFVWASADTTVAVVDATGLVTGVGAGQAEVTATAARVTGRAQLTVVAPVPTTVAVTPDTVVLTEAGQTAQLIAEVRDQAGRVMDGIPVSWSSADTTVAVVDTTGLVTAVGGGAATITATAGEVSGDALVTVMQSAHSVTVSPRADTIAPGDTLRLAAQAYDETGQVIEGASFTWSSSNPTVATVDSSGLVRGAEEGTATITATAGDASGESEMTVTNPDRAALVAFYNATGGPNWVNNDNWLTDAPLREWYGVGTDGNGRVTSLAGFRNNLAGPIPSELGRLTQLTWMAFIGNALTGSIPPQLGNLVNLTGMILGGNDLMGSIPPELGNLAHLDQLDLSSNALTGSIPPELGSLRKLTRLRFDNNALTGSIPPELGSLASLNTLILRNNELSGPIPRTLGSLTQLTYLGLLNNALTGSIPPELGNLANLESLRLAYNSLEAGALPLEFAKLGNLRFVALDPWHCAPRELGTWLRERGFGIVFCPEPGARLLSRALLREDSDGVSLALDDDLHHPVAVNVSDRAVVTASVQDGLLVLSPRGRGEANVEIVPPGDGAPATATVVVRAAIGTFGIDIIMEQPVMEAHAEAITAAADWWSSALDGTVWENRNPGDYDECEWQGLGHTIPVSGNELVILAQRSTSLPITVAAIARGCRRREGPVQHPSHHYPVAGLVAANARGPHFTGNVDIMRHEIGHVLGLTSGFPPATGLMTDDGKFFIGSRAVAAFRAGGGDPDLPGIPVTEGWHWTRAAYPELMISGGANHPDQLSVAALADAGYVVDMSVTIPWRRESAVTAEVVNDVVIPR